MGIFEIFFSRRNEKRWADIHDALKKSFNNIKEDMDQIKARLDVFEVPDPTIDDLRFRINKMEPKIDLIFNSNNIPQISNKKKDKELDLPLNKEEVDTTLTKRQIDMLEIIYRLQQESKREHIPVKMLAAELYPMKNYESNKSLISDYTELLKDLDYVHKIRKGRRAHVKLTEKGRNAVKLSIKNIRLD
jgi:predicted transcriptional regulator